MIYNEQERNRRKAKRIAALKRKKRQRRIETLKEIVYTIIFIGFLLLMLIVGGMTDYIPDNGKTVRTPSEEWSRQQTMIPWT